LLLPMAGLWAHARETSHKVSFAGMSDRESSSMMVDYMAAMLEIGTA